MCTLGYLVTCMEFQDYIGYTACRIAYGFIENHMTVTKKGKYNLKHKNT